MNFSEEKTRELKLKLSREKDFDCIVELGEALANPTRLNILKQLQVEPFVKTVPQLVKELKIPTTTLIHHLEKLEKGNLINVRYKGSSAGTTRIISRNYGDCSLELMYGGYDQNELLRNCAEQSLGVGSYADFVGEKMLFATDTVLYNEIDTPFSDKRYASQLLFTTHGIISYYFSNRIAKNCIVNEIVFSLELCSEASYYDNDYKSDITFWINGKEVATYLSLGDYGDRRGMLTPSWWSSRNTQYGKLVSLKVNDSGVFLNEKLVTGKITLKDLQLDSGNKISLAFGNKEGCEHDGGFNLFGRKFGDYPQDIVLKIYYE